MIKELHGRTALVTGATSGLGAAIARGLSREGMEVVITGRKVDVLTELRDELRREGGIAEAVPADLGDRSTVEKLIAMCEDAIGPLDVLVNNAAVTEIWSAYQRFETDEIDQLVDVNVKGPMLLIRDALPGMIARERGHVVNIGSLAGYVGVGWNVPYSATKAAMPLLTQALRAEFTGTPIGFSLVAPGYTDTGTGGFEAIKRSGARLSPLAGVSSPEKVAKAVIKAIRKDKPEIIVNPTPLRPLLAFNRLAPRTGERVTNSLGANDVFREIADQRNRV